MEITDLMRTHYQNYQAIAQENSLDANEVSDQANLQSTLSVLAKFE